MWPRRRPCRARASARQVAPTWRIKRMPHQESIRPPGGPHLADQADAPSGIHPPAKWPPLGGSSGCPIRNPSARQVAPTWRIKRMPHQESIRPPSGLHLADQADAPSGIHPPARWPPLGGSSGCPTRNPSARQVAPTWRIKRMLHQESIRPPGGPHLADQADAPSGIHPPARWPPLGGSSGCPTRNPSARQVAPTWRIKRMPHQESIRPSGFRPVEDVSYPMQALAPLVCFHRIGSHEEKPPWSRFRSAYS